MLHIYVSIPEDREILHLYISWSVSLHSMAHRGSLLSLLLLLYTHTFFYASTNKYKVCPPYIDTWIFPFSLCLCGNQNNNSVYITARNANPHWSERSMSCGSAASHRHQSHNKEAGIHAAVLLYSCLLCTVMWKHTLSCEHPTGYKPNSATITCILCYQKSCFFSGKSSYKILGGLWSGSYSVH